jgi:hypothetical protein
VLKKIGDQREIVPVKYSHNRNLLQESNFYGVVSKQNMIEEGKNPKQGVKK